MTSLLKKYSLVDACEITEEKISGSGYFHKAFGRKSYLEIAIIDDENTFSIEVEISTELHEIPHDDIVNIGQHIYLKFFEAVDYINSRNLSSTLKKKCTEFLLKINGQIVYAID